jgi:hypothetical protein
MTIIRMLWALFLAGFVAYAFRRTWRWEHGTPMPETMFGGDKARTKETAVAEHSASYIHSALCEAAPISPFNVLAECLAVVLRHACIPQR